MKPMMMAAAMALALAAATGAQASDSVRSLEDIAAQSGLTVRQVQMVLGAHIAYAEYRTSYARAEDRMVRTYGREHLDKLIADYRAGRFVAHT